MKTLEMYRKDNDKLKQQLEDVKKGFDQSEETDSEEPKKKKKKKRNRNKNKKNKNTHKSTQEQQEGQAENQEAEETKTDAKKPADATNGLAESPKSLISRENGSNENPEKQPESPKQKELYRKKSSTENEDSSCGLQMSKESKSSQAQNNLKSKEKDVQIDYNKKENKKESAQKGGKDSKESKACGSESTEGDSLAGSMFDKDRHMRGTTKDITEVSNSSKPQEDLDHSKKKKGKKSEADKEYEEIYNFLQEQYERIFESDPDCLEL